MILQELVRKMQLNYLNHIVYRYIKVRTTKINADFMLRERTKADDNLCHICMEA